MLTNKKTKSEEVYTEVILVTPELADEFLSKNHNNRQLKQATINYYKDMMLRDRWLVNGESIKISESGVLLDGQHRLEAVRQAEKAIRMSVTYNVDEDAFFTIDAGRPRRLADYLRVSGKVGNLPVISAAARIAMNFSKDGEYIGRTMRLPPDILLWYLENHPGVQASVEYINSRMNNICSASISSGLHYIFSVVDNVAAESFFESLISGANLPKGSPILALRTRLLNLRGRGGSAWQKEIIHCFVIAFNAFREGKEVTYLKYLPGFPTYLEGFKGQLSDKAFVTF